MPKKTDAIDITPTPRILRTLGEIPFQTWQCFAELIDNSIDAFMRSEREGKGIEDQGVIVKWSGDGVRGDERVIEVIDSADGMTVEQISNMAKAGYSGNNPVDNLGLFGMGFNIATARLGERTQVLSTKEGDKEWVGIEIDFARLIGDGAFSAPLIRLPKENVSDHGTRIIISQVKAGIYRDLQNNEANIRKRLEIVYSPILSSSSVKLFVQSKRLSAHPYCVWSKERYVVRNAQKISAVIEIDLDLGEELFDTERNSYIPENVADGENQATIIRRPKRLTGWVGIQRYSDPNDFGIDFIRNGRKILISDKSLFYFENPLTGTPIVEYPVELASTWGGRIVGEINADFLLPTYQKNDFDRTDRTWLQVVEKLRGLGPILPRSRKAMGYQDENVSPLGLLVNAYRRQDPGTKNLSGEQQTARRFAEQFYKGDPAFINDDKWWDAAKDADRKRANQDGDSSPVDSGSIPSDDPGRYLGLTPTVPIDVENPEAQDNRTSELSDLLQRSRKREELSRSYGYGRISPFEVKVYEVTTGDIFMEGQKSPAFFAVDGMRCDYFYNPRHSLFLQYQISPQDVLAIYLAERFKTRDLLKDIGKTFSNLVQENNSDSRIDRTTLQERASSIFDAIRQKMKTTLAPVARDMVSCIKDSGGETEETVQQMFPNSDLIEKFQSGEGDLIEVLSYVPNKTLVRLVDRFPEKVLDGQVFDVKYTGISVDDEKSTDRLRLEAKDRVLSFLKDAVWVSSLAGNHTATLKDELIRCSHSINFLEAKLCQ